MIRVIKCSTRLKSKEELCLKVLTEFSNGYVLSRRCLMTLLDDVETCFFFLARIPCNVKIVINGRGSIYFNC